MANHHHRKPPVPQELAVASDLFDKFCAAATLKTILSTYRNLCEILNLKPSNFPQFYPKLKSKLCSWRAQALWNKFDKRANHKCYNRGKACPNTRVLIIGAGPCGLRAAIEAQLLGAKVVVIEKRDRISRNNVLHLWPFVIHDLRSLGAKKFFGKFCAGSIDHISIRQLQCILLKVALLLGVEIHEGVSFESLRSPSSHIEERIGWRAKIEPEDHPVSQYEFDVLIGADGKRNTLEGFKRKEFRGKLAIAITANFINFHSEGEARVEEISGVSYIFNQKFFKDLRSATGIDLENIVYYKDDTHYFVMTAKKTSLLNKGVILKDYADAAELLATDNINKDALMEYAREAADYSTGYKLPQLQFAVNHYGQPDVAMFDFTSMYAAENASRVIQEKGYKLLMCLVGDSLLEPFWPTGSGCARGFLSSMDACWAVRSWGSSNSSNPLQVLAERESIYRLLNQTTPENLSRDLANYMLDPHTRYTNLNSRAVLPVQIKNLYQSDDSGAIEQCLKSPSSTLGGDHHKKRRRKDTQIHHDVLLSWLKRQVALYDNVRIENTSSSFKDGLALCAIIHRYRPDLIDFDSLDQSMVAENNQLAFDVLEKEYAILPIATGAEMETCDTPDNLTMLSYLTQVYEVFRGEIPFSHQRKTDDDSFLNTSSTSAPYKNAWGKLNQNQKLSLMSRLAGALPRKRYRESRSPTVTCKSYEAQPPRKPKKRKSASTAGCSVEERRTNLLENLKKESVRKERDLVHRKNVENLVEITRKNLLWNARKPTPPTPPPRRHQHDRVSRQSEKLLLTSRKSFNENYERGVRARSYDRSPVGGHHQDKLIAAGIMEKVRMLEENQNCEPEDNIPFEDISFFLYREVTPEFSERVKHLEKKLSHSDRDVRELQELKKLPMELNFSGRIKDIETKLKEGNQLQKKPKDLMRAIGRIEKTDWNINALEKKIEENKFGRGMASSGAKVPKWNKQQFDDKFTAVKKKLIDRDPSPNRQPSSKYTNVDNTLKVLERKLKNGTVLEQGQRGANKVSAMAAQLATMNQQLEERSISKSASKLIIPNQGGSEMCHFCNKRVYLMERLNAEGRFFHRGCFRCEYCGTALRLGNYNFDRDGKYGSRFYCTQHFGYPGVHRKKNRNQDFKDESPCTTDSAQAPRTPTANLNLPLICTKDTPERVGFENLDTDKEDTGNASTGEMDEDEWTDHNFGTSANDLESSDEVSNVSDDSENEDNGEFAQKIDIPATVDSKKSLDFRRFSTSSIPSITAEPIGQRNSYASAREKNENRSHRNDDDSDSSCSDNESSPRIVYHEFESEESDVATPEGDNAKGDDDDDDDEVHLKVPKQVPFTYSSSTDSDTEVASDEYSTPSNPNYDEDVDDNDDEDDDDDDDEDEDDDDEDGSDDSATEISTDSEFERNNCTVIKSSDPPILTKKLNLEEIKFVQLVGGRNANNVREENFVVGGAENFEHCPPEEDMELGRVQKNVVETKADRLPFVNPCRGNYLINRTQSTEGVASKISLELKKKYLLGGDGANNLVKKSESTSVLDMRFKSLVDQISEHQKLLNASTDLGQTPQTVLHESTSTPSVKICNPAAVSPTNAINWRRSKELNDLERFPHVCSQSNNFKDSEEATTSQKSSANDLISTAIDATVERSAVASGQNLFKVPTIPATLAANLASGELAPLCKIGAAGDSGESTLKSEPEKSQSKIMAMPFSDHSTEQDAQILRLVTRPAKLFTMEDVSKFAGGDAKGPMISSDKSSPSTPSSLQGDDNTLAVFTETELSDWARDEDDAVSENFEDLILDTPNVTYRRHQRPKKRAGRQLAASNNEGLDDLKNDYVHVCGKSEKPSSLSAQPLSSSFALADLDDMDIDFMDTVGEDSYNDGSETVNLPFVKNSGYIEYVTSADEARTPLAEAVNAGYASFSNFVDPLAVSTRATIGSPPSFNVSADDSNLSSPTKQLTDAASNSDNGEERKLPPSSDDYDNFVHRFQERITPFNNVKDSIDIRKSRKNAKSSPPPRLAEKTFVEPPSPPAPLILGPEQKLEKLEQERSKQKNLIHEMVMSKLQAEGKSIRDRKARRSSARNSLTPFALNSSWQNSASNQMSSRQEAKMREEEEEEKVKMTTARKDEINAMTNKENIDNLRVESMERRAIGAAVKGNEGEVKREAISSCHPLANKYHGGESSFSLPDLRETVSESSEQPATSCVVPPSPAKLQVLECTESIRQQARTRARLMSDSELGLSPEDKLKLLKQKIAARKAVQSAYIDYPKTDHLLDKKISYSNAVLDALDNAIHEGDHRQNQDDVTLSPRNKAARDKDRRKSIIKAVSDFFKKSPIKSVTASSSRSKPKTWSTDKEQSRSTDNVSTFFTELNKGKLVTNETELQPNHCTSDSNLEHLKCENKINFSPFASSAPSAVSDQTVGSSNGDSKSVQSNALRSIHCLPEQENQKRLCTPQEIQQQLDEIEMKQKELELKGVNVEKALHDNKNPEREFELMRELLDMIRERNDLRKYEQMLLLKTKEIDGTNTYLH